MVSYSTVKTHVSLLLTKLGARHRAQLVMLAQGLAGSGTFGTSSQRRIGTRVGCMRSELAPTTTSTRTDPALDRRRVSLYAAALAAVYAVGVVTIIATHTQNDPQLCVLIIMFAPMIGALSARFVSPGVIQWGRFSRWVLAGLILEATVFVAYAIGSPFGVDVTNYGVLGKAVLLSPIVIVISSIAALGEETGWRGFLWPLMRRRWSFLASALAIGRCGGCTTCH